MHILHVVGARPNFMKAAPVMAAFKRHGVRQTLVHTGQHYDAAMSDIFFEQLGMPEPDVNLGVGSGSHAAQTAEVMIRFEEVVLERRPDVVLVYGDVNSTVAATLVCAKLGVRIGHVEAGLRSFDRTMPEELNRLVTDQLADMLFTPSEDGDVNLLREGIDPQSIFHVGNVMIDTLVKLLPAARAITWPEGLVDARYLLVTLHRPSNVDNREMLTALMKTLDALAADIRIVFPVHPRTRKRIEDLGLANVRSNVRLIDPVGYLEFLSLQTRATAVVTDSGGIQEETTYLGVPCLTVRENTERPVTVTQGTNILVGQNMTRLLDQTRWILKGQVKTGTVPALWDGHASDRIADLVVASLVGRQAQQLAG